MCRSAVRWLLVSSVLTLAHATAKNTVRNNIDRLVWEPCHSCAVPCRGFSTSVWERRSCHTGLAASTGPFSSPKKTEWPPFWGPFSVGMGTSGRSGGSKFRRGTLISIPFLGLGPPFSEKKTLKCEHSKNLMKHPVNRPKMHVV